MKIRTLIWVLLFLILLILMVLGINWYLERHKPQPPVTPPEQPTESGGITTPVEPAPKIELPRYSGQARMPLGMNANEIHHEDASFPFVDLFRMADPFKNNPMGLSTDKVEYDANGWPINLQGGHAGTKFIGKMIPGAIPEGQYTVLYDGQGKITYGHDVKVISQSQGRDVITLPPGDDNQIDGSLTIKKINKKDPIRNIRILPPGGICHDDIFTYVKSAEECVGMGDYLPYERYYNSIVFNPDYLNYLKDFQVVRFMGMSGITRNPASHWSERPHLEESSWGGTYGERGAPLEIQVELANRLKVDGWFNVPHQADDDYVRNTAQYLKDHLDPELKVYIEYTNEAWNTNFSHSEYTQKKGIEAGYSQNSVEAGQEYYVVRSLEVFKIFEEVFAERKDKLVRLLGSWDTRPDLTKRLLTLHDAYKKIDAIAIAPYFGGNVRDFRTSTTVDEIFKYASEEGSYRSLAELIKHIQEQTKLTREFGVDLIAYEGGQSLVDWVTRDAGEGPNPLFFAANRDPRMGELYTKMLNGWKDAGGGLFVLFSSPRTCQWYGCWGLKEHIRQDPDTAPKYHAVKEFMKNNPDWGKENTSPKPSTPEQVAQVAASVAKQLASEDKPRKPEDPVIVFRPAKDPERYFFLENPRTLDTLITGDTWAKKDLFGKWQAKWDEKFIYLTVKVYDENMIHDSEDPTQDDSIEFMIDADNSRLDHYDGVNDFRFIFAWGRDQVIFSDNSPDKVKGKGASLPADFKYTLEKTADGYELQAYIPWSLLGVTPAIAKRVGVEVQVNDDDDGGDREQKISWIARQAHADTDPRLFGVVIISGR
ncbi:sugar-binding protein [Thiofilum flexile]|uniref:sugar-binding protein n=1 Tax=Thiofilum flexile TaxID=125627 RepID=UPI00035E0E24|nr:sugar-binding protein [Thiofilum flexile]